MRRQRDLVLRNGRSKRKMPKKGSLITVIHDGKYDLSRIKEIIQRHGLDAEFKEIEP